MKENNGAAARSVRKRFILFGCSLCVVLGLIELFLNTQSDDVTVQWRREMAKDIVFGGADSDDDSYPEILSGEYHLVDVIVPSSAMGGDSDSYGESVKGLFCKVNWKNQKDDPSQVPMFKDLLKKSEGCRKKRITVSLREIATRAKKVDRDAAAAGTLPRSMSPNGFVFHESRVGSTLVANSLSALDSQKHRVYSESAPLIAAMKACPPPAENSYNDCDRNKMSALIRDVVYMMGRTNDPLETRLFYKIQSIGTTYIENLRAAFPETPWMFVYREPVQVMMSHLKGVNIAHANCLRSKRHTPMVLKKLVRSISDRQYSQISDHEACAAHLAYLCESAIQEHVKTNTGRMVNYLNLVDTLLDDVFPNHFHLPVVTSGRERVKQVSTVYSKGRNFKQLWKDDTKRKEDNASPLVRDAAEAFLYPSYRKMENFAKNNR